MSISAAPIGTNMRRGEPVADPRVKKARVGWWFSFERCDERPFSGWVRHAGWRPTREWAERAARVKTTPTRGERRREDRRRGAPVA